MIKHSFQNQLLSVNICARLLGKIRSIPVSIRILSPEFLTLESGISQGTLHTPIIQRLMSTRLGPHLDYNRSTSE